MSSLSQSIVGGGGSFVSTGLVAGAGVVGAGALSVPVEFAARISVLPVGFVVVESEQPVSAKTNTVNQANCEAGAATRGVCMLGV